jgi:hypothetical protein
MRSCCRIRAMLRLLIKRRPICYSGSPKMPNQQSIAVIFWICRLYLKEETEAFLRYDGVFSFSR